MISGNWHKAGSAAQASAVFHVNGESFTLEIEGENTFYGSINDLHVSNRLGNVERKVTLANGSVFATKDNDAIDVLFKKKNKFNSIIHAVETNLTTVLISLALTAVCTVGFFIWGIPWIGVKVAHALPEKTNEIIASHSFKFLDKYLFDETQLEPERMEQIRSHFNSALVPTSSNKAINYQLHFRDWSVLGLGIPNALALPSGDLILTDKFVELSESQDEIDSVLFHEMGHVIHRHSLEMVVESAIFSVAIMMITGDSNGFADLGISLGSLIISSNYSRSHESEADEYAFDQMLKAKIDPIVFSEILNRITGYMDDMEDEIQNREKPEKSMDDYLSSHPSNEERNWRAKQYSECFQQGLLVCDP